MGGNSSHQVDEAKMQGANVDLDLKMQQVDELFRFKVLLLGAGESGKSTIVKQLKLIHKKAIADEEKVQVAQALHMNVIDCMKSLITACEKFDLGIDEHHVETLNQIQNFDSANEAMISPALAQGITNLYQSKPVQDAYLRRNEFWLLDSFGYYMDEIFRFAEEGYVPNELDIIMARVRTTGIVVTELEQKIVKDHKYEADSLKFQVVDVGGQRNERKKWFHCFDDVKAILFIVNLAGYNQVLFEDISKNRLEESLELFQKVSNNTIFENMPIFVFLNKKDLFESMIKEVDMKNTFPDYSGGMDLNNAITYIQDQFRERAPNGKEICFEMVSARVRSDIRNAFGNVKKTLYTDNRQKILDDATVLHKEAQKVEKGMASSGGGGCCGGGDKQQM